VHPFKVHRVARILLASYKTPNDPVWANDKGVVGYLTFMTKYLPGQDPNDVIAVTGYSMIPLALYRVIYWLPTVVKDCLGGIAQDSVHDDLCFPGSFRQDRPGDQPARAKCRLAEIPVKRRFTSLKLDTGEVSFPL
jgi:hypothetical protein